jgi:hypothetical protein
MNKYVIVSKSELDDPNTTIDFSQLLYPDKDKLRYSIAGDKSVIKYETPIPSFFSGKTTYTLSQITPILEGSEWTEVITEDDIL